jgi:hypothetical protein
MHLSLDYTILKLVPCIVCEWKPIEFSCVYLDTTLSFIWSIFTTNGNIVVVHFGFGFLWEELDFGSPLSEVIRKTLTIVAIVV